MKDALISLEALEKSCAKLGFPLTENELLPLKSYLELLIKWNKVMNLVGPYNWQQILDILVVDSFYLAAFVKNNIAIQNPECWDLGAGAGLPGLPLRMLWHQGTYNLVEAREKRALFLKTFLSAHPLHGVTVFRGRAEEFMPGRPAANLIFSRAFMPWEKVLELVQPFTATECTAVFLTLTPLPQTLPSGWLPHIEHTYQVGSDTRYIWALTKS